MIVCDIEEHIPIPTDTTKRYKDVRQKANAACKAADLLEREGYNADTPTLKESYDASKSILDMLARGEEPKNSVVNNALSTPSGAYNVRAILQEYDMEVVHEAKTLRHYVTNKLILESDNNDARIRMKALELLGKISDVGLFTERSEITVNQKSTGELEDTLKSKLRKLMSGKDTGEIVDAVITPVNEVPLVRINPEDVLKDL